MSKEPNVHGGLSKPLIAAIFLFIATTALMAFQNCTQYPAAENVSPLANRLPFPYETSLNNVSYMSCTNMGSSSESSYFTFRAQAGDNHGIKLSSEFIYETRFFEVDERAKLLSEGLKSQNAFLQLALRETSNAQVPFIAGSAAEGQDYDDMFARLDVPPVSTQLTELPKSKFTGLASGSDSIIGELKFLDNPSNAILLRSDINNKKATLALTYGDSSNNSNQYVARAPDDASDPSKVYGNAYDVTFSSSPGSNRKMTNLIERDLTTGLPKSSGWLCRSYLIVRAINSSSCSLTSALQDPAYKALAAALPTGWGNGFSSGCVVAPDNRCYGSLSTTTAVNSSSACNENLDCPHYLSVCYKN